MSITNHPPDFIATLHRHYDVDTLRDWIARYEDSKKASQVAQVKRWRRTLAILKANA